MRDLGRTRGYYFDRAPVTAGMIVSAAAGQGSSERGLHTNFDLPVGLETRVIDIH